MYFDETYRYDKKNLNSQKFADEERQKENDEPFVDPINILNASKPTPKFNTILYKVYLYSNESRNSSPLSDIPDWIGDKEDNKEDNTTSKNEESYLQLNKGDRDSGIQLSDATRKQSRQDYLTKPTLNIWQSAWLKNKTRPSANIICLISASFSVSKSFIHMVTVLVNLNAGYGDSCSDKLLSLKEVIKSPDWKNFEKAIYVEF